MPECSVYEYLYDKNIDNLNSSALNYFGKKYTYRELFKGIDTVAKALQAQGVKPGDVVSVVTVSNVISVELFYAINKIGAISNYINVLLNSAELANHFSDGNSNIVISLDLFGDKVLEAAGSAGVQKVVLFSLADNMPFLTKVGYKLKVKTKKYCNDNIAVIYWKEFIKNQPDLRAVSKDSKEVCFYGHTGGTTGIPKTVLLSDNSFNAVVSNYEEMFPHKRGDVFLNLIIPFVTYGAVINVHMPLCLGLEVVLIPKFETMAWHSYIKKYKPNHICAIPAYMNPIVEDKEVAKMDLSIIKTFGMGGEGMNVQLEERINSFLVEHNSTAVSLKGYGMTEVCATAAVEYAHAHKNGSVGVPLAKNIFMVYDNENHRELTYNEVGEICMQCASTMIGYKDKSSKELLKLHSDGEEWIHTGDLGYIDEDGFVFIVGRMKRIIIIVNGGVGYKVIPQLTENVVDSTPYVKESCVVAMKHDEDIVLRAFVVLESDTVEDEGVIKQNIITKCETELSEFQRPYRIDIVEQMPRTAAGKIDYRKLEEMN